MKNFDYPGKWKAPSSSSKLWRGLCTISGQLEQGMQSIVHNGLRVRFWKDHWLGGVDKLVDQTITELPSGEMERVAAEYVDNGGDWNWELLKVFLPTKVLDLLALVPKPQSDWEDDEWVWRLSANGQFTTSSVYEAIGKGSWCEKSRMWPLIWKWPGPERIRLFLWLVAHERLLTNKERMR